MTTVTSIAGHVIVGVDEAGRGALAGPVVAGACVLPDGVRLHKYIQDSKELTAAQRDIAYDWILRHCLWSCGLRDSVCVDTKRILAATEGSMQDAVAGVCAHVTPTCLYVDGRDKFWFDYPHISIIDGDALEPCISAASIVAKVTRDRLMISYDAEFPQYGFAKHKGYGCEEHFAAINQHGLCSIHRQTFIHI